MIGVGIFMLPASLSEYGSISIFGWIISGIMALLIAVIFRNITYTFNDSNNPIDYLENIFGERYDYEGKDFKPNMKYNLLGTTMNYFIENSILDIPDYIKIDVDGIEHFILEGGDKFLKNEKIKSLSIEINENFKQQYEKVLNLMERYNFRILHKKHNDTLFSEKSKFFKTYNYIFIKQK